MNANKRRRGSYDDDPLPAGTIVYLRGSVRELESVSPGKMSPAELAAELLGEQERESAESLPGASETAERGGQPTPRP